VKPGALATAGPDPAALGGATESPPTGTGLLAALAEAGALVEAGALRAGLLLPLPQAVRKRLASTTAPAARTAGIRLLR
jgi:hypothetical protein